jgi:hypothetical protein
MQVIAMLAQANTRAVEALERIATTQIIISAAILVLVLFALGGMVLLLLEYRAARRLLRTGAEIVTDLKPRLAPLIDRATHVTSDVAGITDNVRRRVDDVLHTLEELRRDVVKAGHATEERVRRFAAVMEVVQSEAESLLLDATATARGVHETARALREPRPALRNPRTAREERDE